MYNNDYLNNHDEMQRADDGLTTECLKLDERRSQVTRNAVMAFPEYDVPQMLPYSADTYTKEKKIFATLDQAITEPLTDKSEAMPVNLGLHLKGNVDTGKQTSGATKTPVGATKPPASENKKVMQLKYMMTPPIPGNAIIMNAESKPEEIMVATEEIFRLIRATFRRPKHFVLKGTFVVPDGYDACSFEAQLWRMSGENVVLEFRSKSPESRDALVDIVRRTAFALLQKGHAESISGGCPIIDPSEPDDFDCFSFDLDDDESVSLVDSPDEFYDLDDDIDFPEFDALGPLSLVGMGGKSGVFLDGPGDELIEQWTDDLQNGTFSARMDTFKIAAKASDIDSNALALAESGDFFQQVIADLGKKSDIQTSYRALKLVSNMVSFAPRPVECVNSVCSTLSYFTKSNSRNATIQELSLKILSKIFGSGEVDGKIRESVESKIKGLKGFFEDSACCEGFNRLIM